MAFMREYGKAENDQGELFPVPGTGGDDEAPVRFRIRAIPFDVALRLESRYGREEMVTDKHGFKRPQRVHTAEEELSVLRDKAEWAWTGSEGLAIEAMDEEAADQYTRLIGQPVSAGQAISLDGRLTAPVKRRLLARDLNLVLWILKRSAEMQKSYEAKAQRLLGN